MNRKLIQTERRYGKFGYQDLEYYDDGSVRYCEPVEYQ